MTAFASPRLQEAVFKRLGDDESLKARLGGIYDEVPHGVALPYIVMGDTNMTADNLKDVQGRTVTFTLLVWSEEPSQLECKELMAEVDRLLARHQPVVPGCHAGDISLTGAAVTRQAGDGGVRYRGRLTYRVQLYEEDAA